MPSRSRGRAANAWCGVTTVQRLALTFSTRVQLVKRKNSLHGCGGGVKTKSRVPSTAVTTAILTGQAPGAGIAHGRGGPHARGRRDGGPSTTQKRTNESLWRHSRRRPERTSRAVLDFLSHLLL